MWHSCKEERHLRINYSSLSPNVRVRLYVLLLDRRQSSACTVSRDDTYACFMVEGLYLSPRY